LAVVLENWERADITLIRRASCPDQKGKKPDLGNYRPVNLALTLGRMLWNLKNLGT